MFNPLKCMKSHEKEIESVGICYRYVNQFSRKNHSIYVGGQRVPYFNHQRNQLRQSRQLHSLLSPICETTDDCEQCHSSTYSKDPTTKQVALQRSRCTSKLHRDLGLRVN